MERGVAADFRATGQTGILIAGDVTGKGEVAYGGIIEATVSKRIEAAECAETDTGIGVVIASLGTRPVCLVREHH